MMPVKSDAGCVNKFMLCMLCSLLRCYLLISVIFIVAHTVYCVQFLTNICEITNDTTVLFLTTVCNNDLSQYICTTFSQLSF